MNAVDVLAVMRDGQTCAEDSRVLAHPQFAYVQDLPERMEQARAAVAELMKLSRSIHGELRALEGKKTIPKMTGPVLKMLARDLDAALSRCKGEKA